MARRAWRAVAIAAGVGLALCGGGGMGLRSWWGFPAAVERAPVACADGAATLRPGQELKVLVWNVQFGASRRFHFFYDGGQAVSVDERVVRETIDALGAAIRAHDPDLVLLQEVDRDSRRTAYLDQHALLREAIGLPCHTAAPYHRVPYVPTPSHEHLGKVDMNLSIFSRYRIDGATRHQLPLLRESPLRRLFNLRRAVLEARLPIEGGGALRVFDTHLSAFSNNDGTLGAQVAVVDGLVAAAEADGDPWVLAGDFNALAPGDDPARIDAVGEYAPTSEVLPLFERWASPFPAEDRPELRTYVPWGAEVPDRALDYLFHSPRVGSRDLAVLGEAYPLSDHLPFVVTIALPP